jgi:WD40 repeat protein
VGSFPAGKLATDVDFSPDGGRLAVTRIEREAGRNQRNTGCVEIWDYRAGKQLAVLRGHAATVGQVAFSADGGRLASASADQTVRVWDLDSGEEEFTFRGPGTATMGVAFSPDGLRLASGDNLGAVHIWDVQPVLEMPRSKGRALSRGR